MEFTEAVARSAQRSQSVDLPLEEFLEADDKEIVVDAGSTEDAFS